MARSPNKDRLFTDEIRDYASARWNEGATMDEINEEIQTKFKVYFGKQTIQYHAAKNRDLFPKRQQWEINEMIARKMADKGFGMAPSKQKLTSSAGAVKRDYAKMRAEQKRKTQEDDEAYVGW